MDASPGQPRQAAGSLRLAFVWDHLFRGDEINEHIRDAVATRVDDAVFFGHDLFGDIHGSDERAVVADIPDKMLEYRVSAAIVGVGA